MIPKSFHEKMLSSSTTFPTRNGGNDRPLSLFNNLISPTIPPGRCFGAEFSSTLGEAKVVTWTIWIRFAMGVHRKETCLYI